MSDGDSPEVAAAIARLKSTLDTQAVMALVGLSAITAYLVFDMRDEGGLMAGLLTLAPWFVGLSVVLVAANRWTLALKSKSLRRRSEERGAALRKP